MKRSGILMHISSLPSNYGIGTMGEQAYKFIDFLAESKSSIWQVLPLGQTGYGDSPYQSVSSFAGNPYFIDLDVLVTEGLLSKSDLPKQMKNQTAVNFGELYNERYSTLKKSFDENFYKISSEVATFKESHDWADDYSIFMALKKHFDGKSWLDWDDEKARVYDKNAINAYKTMLKEDVDFYCYIQYLFFKQWKSLREYANKKGIKICGDLPIYCALDSADVWANSSCFELSDKKVPKSVAGVPPDYFSADGQLWGNPLYDWKLLEMTHYEFWVKRMRATSELFDIARIDHFIGFVNYYSIEATATTAKEGVWKQGPKHALFKAIKNRVPELEIIAEDLGSLSQEVTDLKNDFAYPGMHVLMFMVPLQKTHNDEYLPLKITENSVFYTGTHDNNTTLGWWKELDDNSKKSILESFKISSEKYIVKNLIKVCFASDSEMVIIPIQDHLNLGADARMNTPGTSENNWQFRIKNGETSKALAKRIAKLNKKYNR
ncbi:MAG: 4-alpha-glucanotransferase [Bacillota bacterium]